VCVFVCLFVCVCDTKLSLPLCHSQLQEYLTQRIHRTEIDRNVLRNQLDEFKMKLEESNSVSSDLKRQLQEQEEVLKSNNDKQKQLQTTIDGLTKTVELLNKRLQVLCEPPKFVSTFNPLNAELNPICYLLALLGAHHFLHISRTRVKIPALTVGSLKCLRVSGTSDLGQTVLSLSSGSR
jgi:polyhydroxyalkanoate synthesis regulator phasin